MAGQAIDRGHEPDRRRPGEGIGAVGSMPSPRVGGEEAVLRQLPIPAPQPEASDGAPEGPLPDPRATRPGAAEGGAKSPEAESQEQQGRKSHAPSGSR